MRSIQLIAGVLLALAALTWLWLGIGVRSLEVRADGTLSEGAGARADLLDAARAEAAAAASSGTREALLFGPTEEERARAEAEQKAREKRVVAGRVVGPDGAGGVKAIAGAQVWASTSESDWMKLPLDVESDGLPARWVKVKTAETDGDGRFELEDLSPGPLRIAARASGFAPAYLDHLDLPPYQQHSVGDVKLEVGVVVKGRVIDRDGEGVGGAKILIALDCVHRSSLVALPGRGVPAGMTAADGTFVVDQLSYGPWHLLFEAPGYVLAEASGKIERAGQTEGGVIVRLEEGVEIRGKVVCKEAALPAGVRVGARLLPPKQADPAPGQEREDAGIPKDDVRARYGMVEADGTFVIAGLKVFSSYRLVASRANDDDSGWKAFPAVEAQTVQAGTHGVELVYKPESVLVFRAVDDATGEPITELVASAGIGRERALRDDKGEIVRSFPDGRVRYPELRVPAKSTKPVVLRVSATGYKDHENKDVGLAPGAELDLGDIRLVREHVVVATVVDAVSKEPIAGARVLLSDQKSDEELVDLAGEPPESNLVGDKTWNVGTTGPDGRARVTSIPAKSVGIVASAKGHRPSRVEHAFLPHDGDHALTLELGRGGIVVVKVSDATGRAVAGVGVRHRLPRRTGNDEDIEDARKSDALGIVRFEALAQGVHAFQMHEENGDVYFWDDEGSNTDAQRWIDVRVVEGETAEVEITAPPRGDVYGVVREGGRELEGAHVKFVPRKEGEERRGMAYFGGAADPFSTVTAADGAWKLANLRCGEYSAVVMTDKRRMGAEFRVRVTPEGSRHDFDLDVSCIEGRVLDENGAAVPGARVDCWRVKGGLEVEAPYHMVVTEDDRGNPRVDWRQASTRRIETDRDGRYVVSGLVSNEPVVVSVEGEWVERGSSPQITLSPGETRHGVDFKLRLAGKIEVSIVTGGGRRQDWYSARVMQGEGENAHVVAQTWVGAWNRANTITGVVPGTYKLVLRRHGGENTPALAEAQVEVRLGEVTRVTLDPAR